jgi:hypothetical protein
VFKLLAYAFKFAALGPEDKEAVAKGAVAVGAEV